jgi:Fanconi anemia group J protein
MSCCYKNNLKYFLLSLGCSYYAARSMSDDAQLVFCPYSYVINPVIRGAMDVDIKGAIVILDEAQYVSSP